LSIIQITFLRIPTNNQRQHYHSRKEKKGWRCSVIPQVLNAGNLWGFN
jgi:hypothetical protein